MEKATQPEVWLRGPLPDVLPLLQPVAHALMQARNEVNDMMSAFSEAKLWESVAGLASPGFHLRHMRGVMDRLTTYANGQMLTEDQLQYLKAEATPGDDVPTLLAAFNKQVDDVLIIITQIDESTLTEFRGVGRAQLPSTLIGLLVHIAEHTMRHVGQLLVTVKVLSIT